MLLNQDNVKTFYENYAKRVALARQQLGRPLAYAEKILFSHMNIIPPGTNDKAARGKASVALNVDRVVMQDATAQMAVLQFILTNRDKVAVPTSVHCDHLIRAHTGARQDLQTAQLENNEVYQFLKSAANKYGMGFWKPGSGIIHQVVLENYAIPGNLIMGTDSHTPNAGGLATIAIGVGGADAVDAMAGLQWSIPLPKLVGVKLIGKLTGWTSPKDIILKVAQILTVKGGTGKIVEYFGQGTQSISATGKATITNMGAEIGATTSVFPYDEQTGEYLQATRRGFVADLANQLKAELCADPEVEQEPEKYYDEIIEINLSELQPHIVGPFTPDLARPVSKWGEDTQQNNWPAKLNYCLIGSCTNSSYEDMQRAASIARQAAAKGMKTACPLLITPGSEQILKTIERDGLLNVFERIGGTVLANACGPCIGQWKRDDIEMGAKNSILSSYNRNFKKRNDANPNTHAFIGSPEIVTAMAFKGTAEFNPVTDQLTAPDGTRFVLEPPFADTLPKAGFVFDDTGYDAPTGEGEVTINEGSERLAFLDVFGPWQPGDFSNLRLLLKAQGKCTTDHISPAGPWLKYRGHLDNISKNLFIGAVNAFGGAYEPGTGKNLMTGETQKFTDIARYYKQNNTGWIVVGDENYGEGSSREHAAMEPRYLGCRAVIVKSFARIHETNLKKQGVLALTFVDPAEYLKFREDDVISIPDTTIEPGKNVVVEIKHSDGSAEKIETKHTLTPEQIEWLKAGSALAKIRNS